MSFNELQTRFNKTWGAIGKARASADAQIQRLNEAILIDGRANQEHANTASEIGRVLDAGQFVPPGRSGIFGNLAFSHEIIHQIGGPDDSNRNTTRRLLLLLESATLERRVLPRWR